MQCEIRLLAPGFATSKPYLGEAISVDPRGFRDTSGYEVRGIEVRATFQTRWRTRTPLERASTLALGAFDLMMRWPNDAAQYSFAVNGERQDPPGHHIDDLAAYEIGEILGGRVTLPGSIRTASDGEIARIDELIAAVVAKRARDVDRLLGPFAQISVAAAAKRPADRLGPLWSAFTLLRPHARSDSMRLRAFNSEPNLRDERMRETGWRQLAAARTTITEDDWFAAGIRSLLAERPRSSLRQLQAATVIAYAARSAIAHGHWARVSAAPLRALKDAESWLWNLVEREIELTLFRVRLPAVVAGPSVTFR